VVNKGEGVGVGAGVGEGACVGEDGGVETGGHAGGDLDIRDDGKTIDHGSDCAGVLVDPVDGAEGAAAGVMVDVDEGAGFEAEEAGAGDAVALEDDDGGGAVWVYVVGGGGVMDAMEIGQGAVDEGDGVGEDDVGFAAELVEHFGESEDGAYSITIRACVGGEEETAVGAEDGKERVDLSVMHHCAGAGSVCVDAARFCSRFRMRLRSSSMRPVIF